MRNGMLLFRFAGLMNGQHCYCISKYGGNGPSTSCGDNCIDKSNNYCGSSEAISVYSTGQQGTLLREPASYVIRRSFFTRSIET